jgi:predicted DNA-binding mobile mystery protein A
MALGITLQQLANRLSVSKQSVRSMEQREIEGGITLQSMRELARALDMQFVYGFVPKDGTLDALIERRAREIAREIVSRTSNSMQLEDQQNSAERLRQAVNEHTEALIREMPKFLWD